MICKVQPTKVQSKFQNKGNHPESVNWRQIVILEKQ